MNKYNIGDTIYRSGSRGVVTCKIVGLLLRNGEYIYFANYEEYILKSYAENPHMSEEFKFEISFLDWINEKHIVTDLEKATERQLRIQKRRDEMVNRIKDA